MWSLFFVMETAHFIREALEELFTGDGPLSDCFVVDIVPKGHKGITVYFDSDSGVTLEKCSQVSRYLEKRLDERQYQGGDYVLDVSSPGIDRPLMQWRQYPRQKGRSLLVRKTDGTQIEGILTDVGMDAISLQTEKTTTVDIPFTEIAESFVQITF